MISTSEYIAVLLFGLSFLVFLYYLLSQRPVIFVSFFFIIFTLAWRMLATMYIDLAGPVYSSQLIRDIGPGTATVIHSLAYVITLNSVSVLFQVGSHRGMVRRRTTKRSRARREHAFGFDVFNFPDFPVFSLFRPPPPRLNSAVQSN